MDSFPFEQYTNDTWYGQSSSNSTYQQQPISADLGFSTDFNSIHSKNAPPHSASWSTAPSPYLPSSNSIWPASEQQQQQPQHLNPHDVFHNPQHHIDLSRQNSMASEVTAVDPSDQLFHTGNGKFMSSMSPIPSVEQPHFPSMPSTTSIHLLSPDLDSALPSPTMRFDDGFGLGMNILPTTELSNGHARSTSNSSSSSCSSSSATPASSRSSTSTSLSGNSMSSLQQTITPRSQMLMSANATPNTPVFEFQKPYPPYHSHNGMALPSIQTSSLGGGPLLPQQSSSAPATAPLSIACPPPVKRRRGRPRILRSPSDNMMMDGSVSRSNSSNGGSRSTRRQPHNMVERKYREGLNKEMDRLRSALPHLAGSGKRKRGDGEDAGDYSDDEDEDGKSTQKASKALVLQTAVEEIEMLRRDRLRLEDKVEYLEQEVRNLREDRLVKEEMEVGDF